MARMRSTLVAATATIAALAAPTTAAAATTSCDGLQQALDSSTPNSVVTLVDDEVCLGHFNLPEHPITFEGGDGVATLSGDRETQILSGFDVGATTIRNLTFVDGLESEGDGGAIHLEGNSPATIEGNEFFRNRAEDSGNGGAVSLELDNDVLTAARGVDDPIVLRGNTFGGPDQGNFADDEGGAVYIDAFFRSVIVEDNTFADNLADDDRGGGLQIDASQSATLDGNTFLRNEAGDDGGGAAVETCVADITGNVFDSNRITDVDATLSGGGLFLSGSVCRNSDNVRGGRTTTTQSDNRFLANTISGEFSTGQGGGEAIEFLDVVSTSDRVVGNSIDSTNSGFGGGLFYEGDSAAPLVARNLVAAGNEVTEQDVPERGLFQAGQGGGLFLTGNGQGSEFSIEDSTIEANTAGAGSGIAGTPFRTEGLSRGEVQGDALVLANSIVFGNTGATDNAENPSDGEINGFVARDVRSSDTCVHGSPHPDGDGADPNSNVCVDPQLTGPSGDENVDQTAGSPTIDAGDTSLVDPDLTKDYAGDGRVLGEVGGVLSVDIGADEFKPVTAEPTPEPTVQPPAAQPPQGAVQGQTQRSCKSKRVFRIRIRVPRGKKALSATVRVNNKKVKVVRGKRLRAPVVLRGLPKGRFTVRITVRLTNGKRITGVRRYHTCIPKLPGDGPPQV